MAGTLGEPLPVVDSVGVAPDDAASLLPSIAVAALETVVLGRVFLVGLLEERNFVIARNIRRACLAPGKKGGGGRTVVAVLGMAHVSGVKRLLTESRLV